ncbi:hypothetical protein GIB67_021445 [Kingdonia uniflora]|uniref:Sugar phosphate transporter domain-containing protein n=1 Tax=Kingdonia uniflora TaxID=39325 RepID=A0A7J7NR48_9MAGN|nr:hypothetical protein GIB67_021445 [Kingdonia uniflora]
MLTLNSAIVFSKYHHISSLLCSQDFHPNYLNTSQNLRVQNHTLASHKQSLSQISEPRKIKTQGFLQIHEYPFGFSSKPAFRRHSLTASGAPQESNVEGDSSVSSKPPRVKLALIFGFWYFQNIIFNIFNKKVLNLFPFPWLLASFQLFVGSIWMLFLWSSKIQPCPKITKPFIIALLGPALFHTIGHISACVSFSKVAVSFTHVIKSSEPVFSVVFSSLLGDVYPFSVWLSILSIVLGCSLAVVTEVSFNLQGLSGALISNVGFVLRNIYSKKSLQNFTEALDNISPLTFSVGNTMKRVVVIISTILVFRNPVRPLNGLGSAIAIFGTFLYSQATISKSGKKIEGEK